MQKNREMTVKAKIEYVRNPLEDESTSLLARFIQLTQGKKIDIVKEFYHFMSNFYLICKNPGISEVFL